MKTSLSFLIGGPVHSRPAEYLEDDAVGLTRSCPPFSRSPAEDHLLQGDRSSRYYLLSLSQALKNCQNTEKESIKASIICFLPLLQAEILDVRQECIEARVWLLDLQRLGPGFKKRSHDSLYNDRGHIRQVIFDLEKDWYSFVRYLKTNHHWKWSEERFYNDIESEIEDATAEAYRLESQLRDHLQLEAGQLGLEESRRSIELSNRQILEAERSTC